MFVEQPNNEVSVIDADVIAEAWYRYLCRQFVYLWISEKVIFVYQNLIFNRLTYLVHATSVGELISFGFSDRSVWSLVSAKRSVNRWVQTKKTTSLLGLGLALVSVWI